MGTAPPQDHTKWGIAPNGLGVGRKWDNPKLTAVVLSNYILEKKKRTLRGSRKTNCYPHKRNRNPSSSRHPGCTYSFLLLARSPFSNSPSSEHTGRVSFGFLNGGRGVWLCVEAPAPAFPSRPSPRGARYLDGPQMHGATKAPAQCGRLGRPSQVRGQHTQGDLP